MYKVLTAIGLGIGLSLATFLLFGQGSTAEVRAQGGTGVIRVALTGSDAVGCGSVASPCATVQFAVDEALAGEEIHIATGTYAGVQLRQGLSQTVYISKALTLRGGYTTADGFTVSDPLVNPTTLDAQLGGRVIVITETGGNVILENLTVTQGTVSGNNLCPESCGGGILAMDPLILRNLSIISNTATRDGGGVSALSQVIVADTTFARNHANFDGGGLMAVGSANISSSSFVSNTSVLAGGAAQTEGPATILDSQFEQNQSTNNVGGALRLSGDTLISATTFISNSTSSAGAIGHGGAVYGFELSLDIVNSRLENNHCRAADCDGGGVYLSSSFVDITLNLTNTLVISNSAMRNGGGVSSGSFRTTTRLQGGSFARNLAGGGGTAFSDGGGGINAFSLSIEDTTFLNNISLEDGGGVWINTSPSLNNVRFENNLSSQHGGGLAIRGLATTDPPSLNNLQFINNTAQVNGGGLWVEFNGAEINGGRFENNQANGPDNVAANGGGGLWARDTVAMTGTQFFSNTAQSNGGGLHVSQGDAILRDGLFDQNEALGINVFSGGGGGLYLGLGNLTIEGTTFQNNSAVSHGAGGRVTGMADLTGGLFQNNQADNSGGGLLVRGKLTIDGTQFVGNRATTQGGALFSGLFSDGVVEVDNGLFFDNRSQFGGGINGDIVILSNTQFISNTATTQGGGIAASNGVTATNSLFQENHSLGTGGGIAASFDPVILFNSQILSNTAVTHGGGVYSSLSRILPAESLFQNNQAGGNGGGAYTAGQIVLSQTQFISNTAQGDGGGGFANSGVIATAGHFERNSSGANGGGVSAPLGELIFKDTVVLNNRAVLAGGGAYNGFRASMQDGRFENNQAQNNGGGLRIGNRLYLSNTLFIRNDAQNDGGGLYMQRSSNIDHSRLVNGLFAQNTAGGNGEALYLMELSGKAGVVDIVHTTIASPAQINGSAIYAVTGTVRITNSIISNHTTGIEQAGGSNIREDYNLFFDTPTPTTGGVVNGGNSFSGNPVFAAPAADDYHLTINSQALNRGIATSVLTDFEGEVRPMAGGFDLGFDETAFASALVINEIMPDPKAVLDDDGEWFEVYNAGTIPLDLNGCTIADSGGESHVIDNGGSLIIDPEQHLIFARNATFANNGGVVVAYSYGEFFFLNNTADEIILSCAGFELDRVEYDASFPLQSGASLQLFGPTLDNNIPNNWCLAVLPWSTSAGDVGSPGEANTCYPDLTITKTASPTTLLAGEPVVYTLVYSNAGLESAGAVISDIIPPALISLTVTSSGPALAPISGVNFAWGVSAIPPGTTGIITISGFIDPVITDAIIVNTAQITTFVDSKGANNQATETIYVGDAAPSTTMVYLPMLLKDVVKSAPPPDLIVDYLVVTSNAITVVIKNVGGSSVVDAFWVDAYINPIPVPTTVNQTWYDLGTQGLAWGVIAPALPLAPTQSLTLTLTSPYYNPAFSNFTPPLALGTPVYAQVDSFNLATTYGGVLESHEILSGTYNNISQTLSVAGTTTSSASMRPLLLPGGADGLPLR